MSTIKIGIVGAGAAGLSAAYFLRKKGYYDITLLEKANEVGGKCKTISVENRPYEMGACLFNTKYEGLLSIYKSLQWFKKNKYPSQKLNMVDLAYPEAPYQIMKFSLKEWFKFYFQVQRFKKKIVLDYNNTDLEHYQSFQRWLKINKVNLADFLALSSSSFGYGYFNEVPALYLMRYYDLAPLLLTKPLVWLNKHHNIGFQDFWKKVAEPFSVILNTEVYAVRRSNKIQIASNQGDFNFDYLIYACPLDETLKFDGTTAEEKAIFSKIYYYDYHTMCVALEGMPKEYHLWPANSYLATDNPQWQFLFRPWIDRNVAVIYALGRRSLRMQEYLPAAVVAEKIERDFANIGLKVQQSYSHMIWKYFPHFGQEDLEQGIYRKLNALQSVKNTFYIGELLNFSTNEHVIRYSNYLVEKFF